MIQIIVHRRHFLILQAFISKIRLTEQGYLFAREANGVAQTGLNVFVSFKLNCKCFTIFLLDFKKGLHIKTFKTT